METLIQSFYLDYTSSCNIVVSCNHVLSSSVEDNLTSTAPAAKAGFDRGSWVVSEKTAEDSSSHFLLRFAVPHFWWNVSTRMDWLVRMPNFSPRANMQTAAFSWPFILLVWFCVKTNPFALQSLLGASRAIVILNFSSFSNAMQTCKWYIGNLVQMVLVLVHSQNFLGNYVFCATPFDHVLAKFEFGFGFQDEGVFNDAFGDNPRGHGHRETKTFI